MDVLMHFRSIEELTKTLSREQGLLSEMFEKRKLMKFPSSLAELYFCRKIGMESDVFLSLTRLIYALKSVNFFQFKSASPDTICFGRSMVQKRVRAFVINPQNLFTNIVREGHF